MDFSSLQEWVGREQRSSDEVTLPAIERLAATLDYAPVARKHGDAIPDGWYSVLFGPLERQSGLAADGHPAKGHFLPPVPLPRRMFAGRRVEFVDALRIGDKVDRVSRIARIEPKQGRSGQMCFVTVRHEMSTQRGTALVEEQDLVYREQTSSAAAKRETPPGPSSTGATWTRTLVVDPAMLFRYSAVTFNAHRIHYDVAYTRDTEGYPDLVVNGGLTTLLLWELAHERSGLGIRTSASKNVGALYVDRPITLCGWSGEGGKLRMLALDAAGQPAVEAELEMRRQ